MTDRIVVVGAGVGGLSAAAILARRGFDVTVLERDALGGKLRQEQVAGRAIDVGPTVLTMPWLLEQVFEAAGASMSSFVRLTPLEVVARHAWQCGATLDLFADEERTADAVGAQFGAREATAYRAFAAYAARIYELTRGTFIEAQRPTIAGMLGVAGRFGPRALKEVDGHRTMWSALQSFFRDPRLVQLFARYATYCGASPLTAPATLNVVSHVERLGVHAVQGGMIAIVDGLSKVAETNGARLRRGAHVEEISTHRGKVTGVRLSGGDVVPADAVVFNGDAHALASGLVGQGVRGAAPETTTPSLSAVTLAMVAKQSGFPLDRHNVFFSEDYAREMGALDRGELPDDTTVYLCAQDRPGGGSSERFFVILNAPPTGRSRGPYPEPGLWQERVSRWLSRFSVTLSIEASTVTTPQTFASRFPGTGGALYGPASTSMWSSFSRAAARGSIDGLYLAGGSAHPGPGVPMAATSGRMAALAVLEDRRSTARSPRTAMLGGTSMR